MTIHKIRQLSPFLLVDVLVKDPDLRIYTTHGVYPFIEETIALMRMYQPVYMDISAINWLLTQKMCDFIILENSQTRVWFSVVVWQGWRPLFQVSNRAWRQLHYHDR